MGVTLFNTNSAMMSLGELNKNINKTSQVLAKLSSGEKINQAKDGASEYEISEKMRAEVRAIEQDGENVQNGSSVVKIAEGAVEGVVDNLRALKELAINAATDTNTDEDRVQLQKVFDQTIETINDVVYQTKFNGMNLIDGTYAKSEPEAQTVYLAPLTYNTETGVYETTTDADGNVDRTSLSYTILRDGIYALPADIQDGGTIYIASGVQNVKFVNETKGAAWTNATSITVNNDDAGANILVDMSPALSGVEDNNAADVSFDKDGSKAPMHIQNGTHASQSMDLFIGDMHINAMIGTVPNSADYEHLKTLEPETSDEYIEYEEMLMKAKDMTLKDVSLLTRDDARLAIRVIDSALSYALDQSTSIAAYSRRLDYNLSNIETYYMNMQAADSTIRDADMAREMTEYTKSNVLQQASQAMLAQANQTSSQILNLLQG